MEMGNLKKNACIVVLGDIGRSPRMQYHSLSLVEMGYIVDIIGYGETEPMDENPPAIPSLVICWLYCKIIRSKFIVDWHNYAHTIMALSLYKDHPLVRVTKRMELFIGRKADHNFCVTNAMKNDLYDNWNISASTLYDKPPKIFRPITLTEKHAFLQHLGKCYKNLILDDSSTLFTEVINNEVYLKQNRPGLIVSSTSWTEDEDFSIFLAALQDYENHILDGNDKKLPNLICFITGKGHLKSYYSEKIAERNWQHISIITPWLEYKNYPLILASADLGVCLHTSSSGLDLPMKVVDMFGCGLPVSAYDFKCLGELVKHGKNGYKFTSIEELSQQVQDWFENFPHNEKQKEKEIQFKSELHTFQKLRWRENWLNVVWPILQRSRLNFKPRVS